MAKVIAEYLIELDERSVSNKIEFSERFNGFKLKLIINAVPSHVAKALRLCTRETTSTFSGKRGIKVRLLSADLLSDEVVLELKSLIPDAEDFADWVEASIQESEDSLTSLGTMFYELHR